MRREDMAKNLGSLRRRLRNIIVILVWEGCATNCNLLVNRNIKANVDLTVKSGIEGYP